MDNAPLRIRISYLLKTHPSVFVPFLRLVQEIRRSTPSPQNSEIERELALMEDEGFVERRTTDQTYYRLTSSGTRSTAPLSRRIMEYLVQHWLAILALIISVIALFK